MLAGRRTSVLACAALAAGLLTASTPVAQGEPAVSEPRPVMLVGNNWDGTVDLLDAKTLGRYQRINVVPDLEQRKAGMTPDQVAAMLLIRQTTGEGHDQLVDDIAVSPDGRKVVC